MKIGSGGFSLFSQAESLSGLKGIAQGKEPGPVYPKARIQLCIVHMVRNSLRFVSWKDYKAATRDLKAIYQAPTEEAGQQALEAFAAACEPLTFEV